MKYHITLIIVLIAHLKIFQPGSDANYLKYHQRFAGIEELIVNEKFKEAELELAELFSEYEVKFVKDVVIAAQVSILNNNNNKALNYLRKAISKGVKMNCLKSIPLLKKKIPTSGWNNIAKVVDKQRRSYSNSIDIKLAREFHNRYKEEQESKGSRQYQATVQNNFGRIRSLIYQGVSIGEENLGIDDQDYAPSIEECDMGNSKVVATLLHYAYPINEIGMEWFDNAIERGELHPREFASIYTFQKNKVSKLYQDSRQKRRPLPHYTFNFPFGEKSKNIKKVNTDRMKFGICKYEVDLKKEEVMKKYGIKLDFGYK